MKLNNRRPNGHGAYGSSRNAPLQYPSELFRTQRCDRQADTGANRPHSDNLITLALRTFEQCRRE